MKKDFDTKAAASELIIASLPPLRQPGDMTRQEITEYLKNEGYEIRNRNQLNDILNSAGFRSMWVWDNEAKGQIQIWRAEDD